MSPALHRSHDYRFLIRRWKAAARELSLRCRIYSRIDDFPLYVVETRKPQRSLKNIYLSAGIHGDEPASTEGLLAWAQANPAIIRQANFILLPCLNPWGLTNNRRSDAAGNDLNRSFHQDLIPGIRELKILIQKQPLDLAVTLHEDFDGEGVYLYEIDRKTGLWGSDLLQSLDGRIQIDPRRKIDLFQVSVPGCIRRSRNSKPHVQGPEALFLVEQNVPRVFTIETPSEFAIEQRIAAQEKLVSAMIRRTLAGD